MNTVCPTCGTDTKCDKCGAPGRPGGGGIICGRCGVFQEDCSCHLSPRFLLAKVAELERQLAEKGDVT